MSPFHHTWKGTDKASHCGLQGIEYQNHHDWMCNYLLSWSGSGHQASSSSNPIPLSQRHGLHCCQLNIYTLDNELLRKVYTFCTAPGLFGLIQCTRCEYLNSQGLESKINKALIFHHLSFMLEGELAGLLIMGHAYKTILIIRRCMICINITRTM